MGYKYAVLGSGRQGTAAAYDLAKNGDAERITIADVNLDQARLSSVRINKLIGDQKVFPLKLDVQNRITLIEFLKNVDVLLSAVPYYLNLSIADCAIEACASMCDLGGNTEIVFRELELNQAAMQAGITIVPDCGMVPGLGTSLCVYAMSLIELPEEVFLWDGGLPLRPREPWNYVLTFHFEGLVNEYFGDTEFLRNGQIVRVPCFQEYELINLPQPIGQLEAFTTAGGTSSAPRTFFGKLKTYQNKTLRYKGHFHQWKTFYDAGLLDSEPISLKEIRIRPRDILQRLIEPMLQPVEGDEDVCIIRTKCIGTTKGKPTEAIVDLLDYYDPVTGFTAMERTTGFHAAIMASLMARGEIKKGAVPVELAIAGDRIVHECKKRGMQIETTTL